MYLVQFICEGKSINEAAFISELDAQVWVMTQKKRFPPGLKYRVVKAEQYLHNMTPVEGN